MHTGTDMTTTYYAHEDASTGESNGPRAKYRGTPKFGYKILKTAIRWCPPNSFVVERHTDGMNDWGGRVMYTRSE